MSQRKHYAYALMLILMGSIFSLSLPSIRSAYASHQDLTVEIEDIAYDQGDDVFISGTIDGGDDGDEVKITITPPSGSATNKTVDLDNEEYSYEHSLSNTAKEGLYTVKVVGGGDTVYSYFTVDDDDDDNNQVTVIVDEEEYSAGDEVQIAGEIADVNDEEDQYEITIKDPDNDEVENSDDEDLDNDEFSFNFDLDNDAVHGRYAVIVDYDGDKGYAVFEVEDDGGSSSGDAIEVTTDKTKYSAGDTVTISGTVEDVDDDTIAIEVRDPSNVRIVNDDADVENNGDFEFEFDLDDDAEDGTYEVTVSYGNDDATTDFTVGAASGGSSGLTVRLDKSSYLAGDEITVTGKVPKIVREQLINIDVFDSEGMYVGSTSVEPDTDLTYTGTVKLKSSLDAEKGYKVNVSYDNKEASATFEITGQKPGLALSAKTDKPRYDTGAKITISGSVGDVVAGKSLLIQVYNPDGEAYRFDPVTPKADGTYTYDLVVGGKLGIAGEYDVIATYNEKQVKTSFEIVQGGKVKYNLSVKGNTYPIDYEAKGAAVKSMFVEEDDKKLVISTDAKEDGTIEIVLPRQVIDSVEGNSDVKYVVTATDLDTGSSDIVLVAREVSTTDNARTLLVDVPEGTDLVEIQGTMVVPEFGQIAAIVMALSLAGVIVAAKKFRNGFKW